MSQLDQAKREATRLFKLAKTYPKVNEQYQLPFSNLSMAKEYVANINGYPNWHDYEENLKTKDSLYGEIDFNKSKKEEHVLLENIDYFLENRPFKIYKGQAITSSNSYEYKKHIPVVLGKEIEKTRLFGKKENAQWLLNNYPALYYGDTGSGQQETLLSLAHEYISNNEGCIYLDSRGFNTYSKLFAYCQQSNKLNNLYFLNFPTQSYGVETLGGAFKTSNSIDLINPMIGNEFVFTSFFGMEPGILINQIGLVAQSKNWLLNIDSLHSIAMLPNLIKWAENGYWENATQHIQNYLNTIGYDPDRDNSDSVEKHALNFQTFLKSIKVLNKYYGLGVFSITPEVSLYEIFKNRKICMFSIPDSPHEPDTSFILGKLISANIVGTMQKLDNTKKDNHWQNIIMDDIGYFIRPEISEFISQSLVQTNNNWILGTNHYNYSHEIIQSVIAQINTHVIMKVECRGSQLPTHLKMQILDNIPYVPPVFTSHKSTDGYWITFIEQREGQAYIFSHNNSILDSKYINNNYQSYLARVTCTYRSPRKPENIFVNTFPPIVKLVE